MHLNTLFKRTSTGAVQEWHREIDGDRYRSISGQVGGSLVESGWVTCVGKNLEKSNATTGEEQAALECAAAYTKKLAQGGYHESVSDIDISKFFKPMLAKSYEDYPVTDFACDVFSQPKLDGVRCVVTADGMWTRAGKSIDACPHIFEALKPLFAEDPDLIFDGELYADKLSDDFSQILSLVRKKSPDAERLQRAKDNIEYHVYDLPSFEGSFIDRSAALYELILAEEMEAKGIRYVQTNKMSTPDEMDAYYAHYMEQGYEGQMIRVGTNAYENKRSRQLLKRKEFHDEEFTVVEIGEGNGNRAGMAGFVTYRNHDGGTFNSGIKGSHDYCKQLLVDAGRFVGGTGTVQFFGKSADDVPRFPVTIALYEGARDI